jgi:hypothetical protein
MARRELLVLVLAVMFAGGGAGVFAQDEEAVDEVIHKHKPFDMLLGFNYGMGITPNIGELLKGSSDIPRGNYAFIVDAGFTYDFYLFYWLSFNAGFMIHEDTYLLLDQELDSSTEIGDVISTPICITIPLGAHFNIPKVEWLYAGLSLTFNIPVASLLDSAGANLGFDSKGKFFVGLPIDIGFDFIKPGKGGGRLFFRVTPEFHEKGTTVPIGFIWQLYNWKLYSRN